MGNKRVPVGFRLLIFAVAFVVLYVVLMGVSKFTYSSTHIWESAAATFGGGDLEGFILLSTAITNLIASFVVYKIAVRAIEKRINKPG